MSLVSNKMFKRDILCARAGDIAHVQYIVPKMRIIRIDGEGERVYMGEDLT